jgi:hypothetical protein
VQLTAVDRQGEIAVSVNGVRSNSIPVPFLWAFAPSGTTGRLEVNPNRANSTRGVGLLSDQEGGVFALYAPFRDTGLFTDGIYLQRFDSAGARLLAQEAEGGIVIAPQRDASDGSLSGATAQPADGTNLHLTWGRRLDPVLTSNYTLCWQKRSVLGVKLGPSTQGTAQADYCQPLTTFGASPTFFSAVLATVSDGVGGFFATFTGTLSLQSRMVARFNSDGQKIFEVTVATPTQEAQAPVVVTLAGGDLLLLTLDSNSKLRAQRYSKSNGAELWAAGGVIVSDAVGSVDFATVRTITNDDGGASLFFFVNNGAASRFVGQKLNDAGATQWGTSGTNLSAQVTAGNPRSLAAIPIAGGAVVFAYSSASYLRIGKLLADGTVPVSPSFIAEVPIAIDGAANVQEGVSLAADGAGGVYATWLDCRFDDGGSCNPSYYQVFGQRFSANLAQAWTAGGVQLTFDLNSSASYSGVVSLGSLGAFLATSAVLTPPSPISGAARGVTFLRRLTPSGR